MDADNLAGIYKEIAVETDIDTAIAMFRMFNGQQIVFPKRLYNKNYIRQYIIENYNGKNIRKLSQELNYSDRRIRQILNEELYKHSKEE